MNWFIGGSYVYRRMDGVLSSLLLKRETSGLSRN